MSRIADWILYWGSEDERVRQVYDKAGYMGFLVMIGCNLVLFVTLLCGARPSPDHIMLALSASIVIGALVVSLISIRRGAAALAKKEARRSVLAVSLAVGPVAAALAWLGLGMPWPLSGLRWLYFAGLAALTALLTAGLSLGIDKAARKRAERQLGAD